MRAMDIEEDDSEEWDKSDEAKGHDKEEDNE